MENMTGMHNKALQSAHRIGCRCEECLTKASVVKSDERLRRKREEETRGPAASAKGRPRYGVTRFA